MPINLEHTELPCIRRVSFTDERLSAIIYYSTIDHIETAIYYPNLDQTEKDRYDRQEELFNDLECLFYHSRLEKKNILDVVYTGKEAPKVKIAKMYAKKYFRSNVEEELISYVCHPSRYDTFEGLGFFD